MGEGKAKATALPRNAWTLHPDASAHGFNQLVADVESQSRSLDGSRQVSLETHKLLEEQGGLVGRNTQSSILDTQAYHSDGAILFALAERGTDDYGCLSGGILECIGKQDTQHLTSVLRIGPDRKCWEDIEV